MSSHMHSYLPVTHSVVLDVMSLSGCVFKLINTAVYLVNCKPSLSHTCTRAVDARRMIEDSEPIRVQCAVYLHCV